MEFWGEVICQPAAKMILSLLRGEEWTNPGILTVQLLNLLTNGELERDTRGGECTGRCKYIRCLTDPGKVIIK